MYFLFVFGLFVFAIFLNPAHAQDAQPSTVRDVSADWQMMARAQEHVAKSVSAIIVENEKLKAEIARRDAEAKAAAAPGNPAP